MKNFYYPLVCRLFLMIKSKNIFLLLLLLCIFQMPIVGMNNKFISSDCSKYKKLVNEVLLTSEELRNNGRFMLDNVGINLLQNTNELIKECDGFVFEQFNVGSTLAEFLIIKKELKKAENIIANLKTLKGEDKQFVGKIKFLESLLLSEKGENDKAVLLAEESLKARVSNKDNVGIAESYWLLGALNEEKKNWNKSINFYKKSIEIGNSNDIKKDFVLESIIHIGNINYQNKNYETAFEYYKLGKEKSIEYKIIRLIPFAYYHLGKHYFDVNNDDKKALKNLKNGVTTIRKAKLENYFITPIILQKIGLIYYKRKNNKPAIKYFKKAINIAEKNNIKHFIPLSYKHLQELTKRKEK